MDGWIYILKFSRPLGNPAHRNGTAQFYVGWAKRLETRIAHHRNGTGAAITAAAVQQGITFEVVFTMRGTKTDERRIKNYKNTRRWLLRQGVAV